MANGWEEVDADMIADLAARQVEPILQAIVRLVQDVGGFTQEQWTPISAGAGVASHRHTSLTHGPDEERYVVGRSRAVGVPSVTSMCPATSPNSNTVSTDATISPP